MKAIDKSMQADKWTSMVDLQSLFFRLTLDSAPEFLFGESVQSQVILLPGYKDDQEDVAGFHPSDFAASFDSGQMALAHRARFMDKVRIGGALFFLFGNVPRGIPLSPLETISPFIFSSDICSRDMSREQQLRFPSRRSNC
jgi:hypothetical protein